MDDHGAEVEVAQHRRTPPRPPTRPSRIAASPAARAAADRLEVELQAVTGTGPRGRVVLADIRRVAAIPTAPTLVSERDVDVGAVLDDRRRMTAHGLDAPSLDDVVIKAAALALREHPRLNASWHDGAVVEHGRVHVGVAVAVNGGVCVPVIRDADTVPLGRLTWVAGELARQARAGELRAAMALGSTFTVAGPEALGHDRPAGAAREALDAAVLAVGPVRELAGEDGGGARRLVRLRLTCDHRVVDGAQGAAFLADVARYVEVPLALAS